MKFFFAGIFLPEMLWTLCDWKLTQTLFLDSPMRINPKNSLTLIGVFYNYFLTNNADLHAVLIYLIQVVCAPSLGPVILQKTGVMIPYIGV